MLYRKQYILWSAISTFFSLASAASNTPEYLFEPDEYEHYMQLVKQINPAVHMQLRNCAAELGEPCIEKSESSKSYAVPGTDLSNGHPLIILASIRNKAVSDQKNILSPLVKRYTDIRNTLPITKTEQKEILSIIKEIAPELYQEFKNLNKEIVHPYTHKRLLHTAQAHIKRDFDHAFSVSLCPFDGLPIIGISQNSFINNPDPETQFPAIIAHELGHYVSHHFMSKSPTGSKSGVKPLSQAYSRTNEYEADRRMVLDFDIPIETAIEIAQTFQEQKDPDTQTLTSTHPLWADRIKHIKSLQPEVELKKAHGKGKTEFDWKALAQEYLQAINQK